MTLNKVNHIAIIMDGNQRWAKKNGLKDKLGYVEGLKKLSEIIDFCIGEKIKTLTVYALSKENSKRESISIIYEIITANYLKFLKEINKRNQVKINFVGEKTGIEKKINLIFNNIENQTQNNNILNLNIVFNYGVNNEIINIIKKIIDTNNINKIDNKLINSFKYLYKYGDPDILIRTGGHKRLSNFIPLNLTYTELFFVDTLWPDFKIKQLHDIIINFTNIKRNYGL